MKFVTLALAFFLAVGCQAASLQADAPASLPTYLGHIRGGGKMFLEGLRTSLKNIASRVEDETLKTKINTNVDDIYNKIIALQEQVAPLTDSAVSTIDEATLDLRTSIYNDMENLKTELEPMHVELRQVINNHLDDYKAALQPIVDEYATKEQMTAFKAKLEPLMANMQAKIAVNVEETKSKLMPMVEKIREKLSAQVETMRQMLEPYVQEYREQVKHVVNQAVNQAQTVPLDEVKNKVEPHLMALKTNFENLIDEVKKMMGQ